VSRFFLFVIAFLLELAGLWFIWAGVASSDSRFFLRFMTVISGVLFMVVGVMVYLG